MSNNHFREGGDIRVRYVFHCSQIDAVWNSLDQMFGPLRVMSCNTERNVAG